MAYGTIKVDTITFTDAGVDKSVTISGLVQNPTFSGNITVTGTVSGNTIRGQTVSGATITGGAAAFTTVTGGVATITSGVFALGSASNPSISFSGDANSGLYSPGADQVAISTNDTGALFIDANQQVYIKQSSQLSSHSSPSLELTGDVVINSSTFGTGNKSSLFFYHRRLNDTATRQGSSINSETENTYTTGLPASFDSALIFNTVLNNVSGEKLRITSDGKLGLGSSSPQTLFELAGNGTAIVRATNSNPGMSDDTLIGGYEFYKADASGNGAGVVGAVRMRSGDSVGASAYMTFSTSASSGGNDIERVRITSGGLVGIGSTTAEKILTVLKNGDSGLYIKSADTNHSNLQLGVDTANSYSFIQSGSAGSGSALNMAFFVGSTERFRCDTSGRLLVGTSSSTGNLRVQENFALVTTGSGNIGGMAITNYGGTSASSRPLLDFQRSRGTTDGSFTAVASGDQLGSIIFRGADGSQFVDAAFINCEVDGTPGSNDMPGRLVFSTTADGASSPTERMRIASNGVWTAFNDGVYNFRTAQAASASNAGIDLTYGSTGIGNGTLSFRVWTNGNVVNTNNSYGAISDLKLKENIVDANSQWNDLKALQVRNYNFKEGQTHTQIGLIAQEVELVSPGLVTESPDRDAEGNDLGTTTKSVNYSVLYMKAVKALQEAMERIETLEAKVAALEGV
jgi:hypothetical protein